MEKEKTFEISKGKYNICMLLALSSLVFMACFYYGMRSLNLVLFSIISNYILEIIARKLYGGIKREKKDFSFLFTGITIALLCPATLPLWIVFLANFIAVLVAKYPFGGKDNYIFNPTTVAVAFITISFPSVFLSYPKNITPFAFVSNKLEEMVSSPALIMLKRGAPKLSITDCFLGNFPSAIGTSCVLVLLACGFFLIYNKVINYEIPIFSLLTIIIFSAIFPRLSNPLIISVLFEVAIGSILFGLIFLATDKTTVPKTTKGRMLYGFFLGIFIIIFKQFGKVEESFLFSLLIISPFNTKLDDLGDFLTINYKSSSEIIIPKIETFVSGHSSKAKGGNNNG